MNAQDTAVDQIRVALLITELDVAGAERCLVNLATRLDRRRFEPVVYCLAPRPADDELVGKLAAAAVPVRFLGARSSWQFLSVRSQLRRLLTEQSPHVLQTFLFHANVLGSLAWPRGIQPRIAWGMRVADPSRWRQRVERLFAGGADRIVCVSEAVAEFARTRTRVPRQKLVVIPNGIDVADYPASTPVDLADLGVTPGRKVIVFVGRLDHQKGLDWLLQHTPEMLRRLPDYELLIVGEGPERGMLTQLAKTRKIADKVHFVGWRQDVPAILSNSELLVLPSRWEGMPNVLLEAMASRKPIVATSAAGVAELLGPSAENQMVSVGDARAFLDKVVTLASNMGLAQSLGEQNRQRVTDQFSLEQMVRRYASLYESLSRG